MVPGEGDTLEIRNIVVYEFEDAAGATTAATGPQFGAGVMIPPLDADGAASFGVNRTYDGVTRAVAARMFTVERACT